MPGANTTDGDKPSGPVEPTDEDDAIARKIAKLEDDAVKRGPIPGSEDDDDAPAPAAVARPSPGRLRTGAVPAPADTSDGTRTAGLPGAPSPGSPQSRGQGQGPQQNQQQQQPQQAQQAQNQQQQQKGYGGAGGGAGGSGSGGGSGGGASNGTAAVAMGITVPAMVLPPAPKEVNLNGLGETAFVKRTPLVLGEMPVDESGVKIVEQLRAGMNTPPAARTPSPSLPTQNTLVLNGLTDANARTAQAKLLAAVARGARAAPTRATTAGKASAPIKRALASDQPFFVPVFRSIEKTYGTRGKDAPSSRPARARDIKIYDEAGSADAGGGESSVSVGGHHHGGEE